MVVRPINKSKPSNRRCWNCKYFRDARVIEKGPYIESRKFYCETSSNTVRYWSCCPYFEWDPDKQYEQPTLTPPNEWVSRVRELDELYTKLQAVTGFTAEQLLEIFAAGYTLKKPDYSKHFAEMENLAEAAPTCKIKDYAETCDECGFCDDTLVRPPEGEEESE